MRFEWDDSKNQSNFTKHGISFEEVIEIFDKELVTWIDDRKDYGEINNNVVILVVHTDRHGITRIISARKANSRERRKYYEYK